MCFCVFLCGACVCVCVCVHVCGHACVHMHGLCVCVNAYTFV